MSDDSIAKIMASLRLDYSPAIDSTKEFKEAIWDLNTKLIMMKSDAIKAARSINRAFRKELGDVTVKDIAEMFRQIDKMNEPIEIKVVTDKAEKQMLDFAKGMGIKLDRNLKKEINSLTDTVFGNFDQSKFDNLAKSIAESYRDALHKANVRDIKSSFATSDEMRIYEYIKGTTIKLSDSTIEAKKNVDGFSRAIKNLAKESQTTGMELDQMAQELEVMGLKNLGANTADIAENFTKAIEKVREFKKGFMGLGVDPPDEEIESFVENSLMKLVTTLGQIRYEAKSSQETIQKFGATFESMGTISRKHWEDASGDVYKYTETLKDLEKGLSAVDTYIKDQSGKFQFAGRTVNDKSLEVSYKEMQKIHAEALKMNKAFDETIAKNKQMAHDASWKQYFQNITKTSDEIKELNKYYLEQEKKSAKAFEKSYLEALKMNKEYDKYIESIKESNVEQMKAKAASIQQRATTKGLSQEYAQQAGTLRDQLSIIQARLQSEGKLTAEEVKQTQQLKEQLNILDAQSKAALSDKIVDNPANPVPNNGVANAAQFYAISRAAKGTTGTIKNVEMGMVEIQRVMSDGSFVFNEYRDNLLRLGVDYGQTFDTVQNIALRWSQSGYNVADSLKLAETSLLALNAGELDAKYATEAMIGIMAQWQLQAEDLTLVMDKINKTADNYSTTAQDLVDGLLRSSGAAKTMNMSIEETLSLLTLMRESSGRTGKEVGNALDSILSYLQRDKSIDVMESMGIKMFVDEARTQFRNVVDIFKDISANWDKTSDSIKDGFVAAADDAELFNEELAIALGMQEEWNDLQKRDMSQAAAGVHRRKFFISLIERMTDVQGVLNNMMDAEGYIMEKNALAMETLEKKQESFKASVEALKVAMGDAGLGSLLKSMVDGGTKAITMFNSMPKGIRDTILVMTELTLAVKALEAGSSLLGLKMPIASAGLKIFTGGLKNATTNTMAFATALKTGIIANLPLLGSAAVIGGAVALFNHIKRTREETEKSLEVFRQQREISSSIDSLVPKYEELASKSELTTEEQQKLLDVKRQITDLLPDTKEALDNENLSLSTQLDIIKDLNKEELERAKQTARESIRKYEDNYDYAKQRIEESSKAIEELSARYDELHVRKNNLSKDEQREFDLLPSRIKAQQEVLDTYTIEVKAVDDANEILNATIKEQNDILDENKDKIEGSISTTEGKNESMDELIKSYEDARDNLQFYYKLLDEVNSKEGLSAQSKDAIIMKHQELLPYLSDEQDLRRMLIAIIKEEEDAQREAYTNMLMNSEEFYNAKIKGNVELSEKLNEYYGIDLENYKSLAKAKEAVETALIKTLSIKWQEYFAASGSGLRDTVNALTYRAVSGDMEASKMLDELYPAYKKLLDSEQAFKNIALDLGGVDFTGINIGKKSGNPSTKSQQEQLAQSIEYNINLLLEEEKALESVRKQIVANKREQDMATNDGERLRLKEKEIELIKEEQQALHNLANTAREVMFGKGIQIAFDGKVVKQGINGLKQQLENTKLGFKFDANNFEIVNYNEIVQKLQNKVNSVKTKKEQDKIKEETDAVIKLADAYNKYLKVTQDAGEQWLDKKVDIYKQNKAIEKEIEDAIKSLEKDLTSIKGKMQELNEQRAFEEFQNDLKDSMLYLEPFANELELLKTKFDLLSDTDYEGKMDVVADQFRASQRYGRRLRNEFEDLSKTTTKNSKETDELINTLTNLQQKIRQNTLNTIEYQKALDNLRIDQIVSQFTDINKELEKELNLVSHNLKMLEGGLLSGTDVVFGVDFALPIIPEDLIDRKRRENEDLIREQQRYEDEIQELKELSLEQQKREQEDHYNKAMSELIKHYDDVISRIKDYHGIEFDEQSDHQRNINDIIADGLATTATNYNDTWAGIVENLKTHLAEIESMINSTNASVNSVSKSSKSSGGGGSGRSSARETWDEREERKRLDREYDKANAKEIDRISKEHGVDSGVARDMDKANKRSGTKIYGKGTDYHDGISKALVGELGQELGILPNGKTVILGKNGAELVDLPRGTQVVPHDETKRILSYTGNIDGEYVKKYKDGTKKYASADELIKELRVNDNFLFHYPKYDGSPIVAINGDVYTEQKDGSYVYSREVWNDSRRDEKLRLLYGDMLKAKYPDSPQYKEYQMIEDFIQSNKSPSPSTARSQALGGYYMGGSRDKDLPSDFKSYRDNRATNMEQIQADQQKIIDDIAKGLDITQFREDLLKRIDEQLQEDVHMQFRLQDDLLKQQLENSQKFMKELEKEYLDAIDDENIDKAKKLAERYNEASEIYLRTSEKLKDSIKERYDYEFSLIDKKLNKEKELQNTYSTQLEILKELNAHNYNDFIKYNEGILNTEHNKLLLLQQSSKELQSQLDLLEVGSYEWNIVNDRLDNINSSIQDTTLSIIKQNKEVLKQKYERELYNVEKSLFNGQTLDSARKELNDKIKYQNEYVGGLEKELIVSKIISNARKNDITLTKEELALLNQSGNIEKIKLERLEKQLSVRMLEQKLANLQSQKTIQSHIQKEDGTFDFAYNVDQDAIYNTEQELKDAKLDLIKWERDLDNRKRQEELDSKSQYLDELRRLTEKSLQAEYQSLSEFYVDANKITNDFYSEIGSSIYSTIDSLSNDFSIFLDNLDNFKTSIEAYDVPENSILGIVGEGSIVQESNNIINELLEIQNKALMGQYESFNEFVDDIESLGGRLNEVYGLIWDNIIEKQFTSNDTLKLAYENLLEYYKDYIFNMSGNTEDLTKAIVDSSIIIEEAINFMTKMVQQMAIEAEKASFSALDSAEFAAQAMINAIDSAYKASQAASDAAKSATKAAISASNIADKVQENRFTNLEGIQRFDTGGYTGNFKGGKLGILDEKELILNKVDTSNLLKAVDITRDIFSNIKIPTMPKIQPAMAGNGGQVIHNHIGRLVFPNVHDAKEIERTILDLPRITTQNS